MDQERRIGRRWRAADLNVLWNIPTKRASTRRRRHAAEDLVSQAAKVIDISVSGASVMAPTDDSLRGGSRIVIGYDGETSLAVIRRISRPVVDLSEDDQSIYGLEFLDAPAHMVSSMMARVAGGEDVVPEERWNRSV